MDPKTKKNLFAKLRTPVHINYISKYVLKMNESETSEILHQLIEEGEIQESELSKNYYSITTTRKI